VRNAAAVARQTRTLVASASATGRREKESGSLALRAGLDVLGHDLACGVLASTATASDRKLALHFEQGPGALVDALANLAVTHCVADAHVHIGTYPHLAAKAALDGPYCKCK
jgi:hypothetical protein